MREGGKISLRIRVHGRNDRPDTETDGQQDPMSRFVCSCRVRVAMLEYLWVKFSSRHHDIQAGRRERYALEAAESTRAQEEILKSISG